MAGAAIGALTETLVPYALASHHDLEGEAEASAIFLRYGFTPTGGFRG